MAQERKYFIKMNWIFNLESMHDFIWCVIYDVEDGKLTFPFEVAGKVMNDEDDLHKLMDECSDLEWAAKSRKVTGKEFGRIKEIVHFRVGQRYLRCVNSGMNEQMAGACFEDL